MTRGFTRGRGANRKFIPTDHGSSGGRVRLSGRKHSSMSGRLPSIGSDPKAGSGQDPADRSSANYYKNARAMEDHGYVEVPDSVYGGTSRYTLKNGKRIILKSGLTRAEVERAIEFEARPPQKVEVFRSFDDQSAKNAEIALKKEHIPYTLTHSTEGSSGQFKMVEFHVSEKNATRAHSIIDTEINADGGTPEAD